MNNLCFPLDLFGVSFAGGCAERRIAGDASVELDGAILVILFPHVARGRPQLVSASGHPELVIGCSHAWDNQGNVVVVFAFDVSPILDGIMMADLDANHRNPCIFENFNSSHWSDLDMIVKNCM